MCMYIIYNTCRHLYYIAVDHVIQTLHILSTPENEGRVHNFIGRKTKRKTKTETHTNGQTDRNRGAET